MKFSLHLKLAFCIAIAAAIFVGSLRASLEDILAPLPENDVEVETVVSTVANVFEAKSNETRIETQLFEGIQILDIHEALVQSLEEALRPGGELTLIPLRELPDLSEYSHPFNLNLVSIPSRLTRGNVLLRFQVENERGILGEWSIPFRVHLYSEVWHVKTRLRRGDLATPSDFELRQVDMLADPDSVPATLETLLGHEYSRDIMPGKPLVWADLTERSLVRKGDIVEVVATKGLMAITMRAVARQDGGEGDIIVLRNFDSAKEFSARVVGENKTEVIF